MVVFQSTLPARGATYRVADERYSEEISIHAPRTGSDCAGRNGRTEQQDFNPRSPHGERPGPHSTNKNAISFQSTLPARGATQGRRRAREGLQISIHAPRTGSDRFLSVASSTTGAFQSTLPARGATRHQLPVFLPQTISIHAPRTGSDGEAVDSLRAVRDFNPRSPHGERPVRRRPAPCRRWNFNPRSPHGERLNIARHTQEIIVISIHAPRTGSDIHPMQLDARPHISIHAPRTGSDTTASD